jgi:hypothetical protein
VKDRSPKRKRLHTSVEWSNSAGLVWGSPGSFTITGDAPVHRKLGRNDPCWCGSGIKYKRRHLDDDLRE